MHQIFISYKREQGYLVQPLKTQLEEEGFDVWWDRHIPSGTEWQIQIDEAIRKSVALIVFMTPEAQASEYVTYEWSFAYGAGVRVIPLLFIDSNKLHPRLGTLQQVKYEDADYLNQIVTSVRDAQSSYRLPPKPLLIKSHSEPDTYIFLHGQWRKIPDWQTRDYLAHLLGFRPGEEDISLKSKLDVDKIQKGAPLESVFTYARK